MKTIFKTITILFLMTILFVACSPEDGKDGEQGPPGTANVMYSDWINQDWNLNDNATFKSMKVIENRINSDFANSGGIVLGFFKFQDNVPYNLPHQNISNKNIRECYPVFFDNNSEVRFTLQSTDGTDLTPSEINGTGANILARYKYVLIPGGSNISSKGKTVEYSKMSYKEICTLFNIPE